MRYDADRIRERLAADGIESVIPPISTRSQRLPCDKKRYRSCNRIEHLFHKLKPFRRLATRYDKLAKTFFAASASSPLFSSPKIREHCLD